MSEPVHVPVLSDRVVTLLAPALALGSAAAAGSPVVVDATLGLGGHAEAVLRRFPAVRLVGLDRDPEALAASEQRLARYGDRLTLVHAVYDELPAILEELGLPRVQGVLFDLGVSSLQLDDERRGFSYRDDVPLDMRMDPTTTVTAADVLNTYPAEDLARVLRDYGEERFAGRIASAVVRQRGRAPFTSSARLVDLVRDAIPAATRRTGGNPAKRTFQALRIEVNGELDALARALPAAIAALTVGGRIVVLSYHSLEDRLVKRAFAAEASSDVPADLPVVPPGHEPRLRLLTRGAELPDEREVAANPRAASARLRAAMKLRDAASAAPSGSEKRQRAVDSASAAPSGSAERQRTGGMA
jgi:16S rRNA (cytosine1402-N4)-methyltransferase